MNELQAYPRYKVALRVLLSGRRKAKPSQFWINVRSLGEGGIGADAPVSLKKNETVLLDFTFQEQILSLPASVRYHIGSFHGFQFIDMTEEQRATIRDYCQNLA